MSNEKLSKLISEYGKEISVLYVEDDPVIREGLSSLLGHYFKEVVTAENGEEGLSKYKNNGYELVISDINMPVMNGIEMCRQIKSIDELQPILITSAYSDSEYLLSLIELGVSGFLMKPIELNSFTTTLYRITTSINDNLIMKRYEELLLEANINLEQKNRDLEEAIFRLTREQNKNLILTRAVKQETTISPETFEYISGVRNKMSAIEFFNNTDINLEDKEDVFESILEDIDIGINRINEDPLSLGKLSQELIALSEIVYSMHDFQNIANAFESLGLKLQKVETIDSPQMIKTLFFALQDNINKWVDNIFIAKTAIDIHYMDASFVSDAMTIESLFGGDDSDEQMMFF